jgi:RNA-directed DNA polymerase
VAVAEGDEARPRADPGTDGPPPLGRDAGHREPIADLNPVLRGWGNDFRRGNASLKFQQTDRYVHGRLIRLLARRGGDRRKPFSARQWPLTRFMNEHGLHRLPGTIRYPGVAHAT